MFVCWIEEETAKESMNRSHAHLKCNKNMLTGTKALSINQAFGSIVDQEEIAKAICKIIRRRATLLDQLEDMEKENQSTKA